LIQYPFFYNQDFYSIHDFYRFHEFGSIFFEKCGKNTILVHKKPQSLRRGGKQALISEWNINYSCLKLHRAQTVPQNNGKSSHCLVHLIKEI
jgi:hypothetical protein